MSNNTEDVTRDTDKGSSPHPAASEVSISHQDECEKDIMHLFDNAEFSDCVIKVGSRLFHLNKAILACRSEYFRALLYGGLSAPSSVDNPILFQENDEHIFELLVGYIYTGKLSLKNPKGETLLDMLTIANRYGFEKLEKDLSHVLQSFISVDNVLAIFEASLLYNLSPLKEHCLQVIDEHSRKIANSSDFTKLSEDALVSIIQRDSFYCPEYDIFKLVLQWHQDRGIEKVQRVLDCVRLPLIPLHYLLNEVNDSGLWDCAYLLEALRVKNGLFLSQSSKGEGKEEKGGLLCRQRGRLLVNENLATPKHNATVHEGDAGPLFLAEGMSSSEDERCYARHAIGDSSGILVKLDMPSIINNIELLLWDCDSRFYSYYVELSLDRNSWTRVIDYSNFPCRSLQSLHFPSIVTQYIRICGCPNSAHKTFSLVSIAARYLKEHVDTLGGLVVPRQNVAVVGRAYVVAGVSRMRNALIDGNTTRYDWDSGYTCHQLGSGCLIVQLAQPYVIGSCRLLLWDRDDRSYSFYIETSVDGNTWTMAVDKRLEECRSWQSLTFSPRTTVFVKIVGTRNSANEVFHCVHFECPSSVEDSSSD